MNCGKVSVVGWEKTRITYTILYIVNFLIGGAASLRRNNRRVLTYEKTNTYYRLRQRPERSESGFG